MNFNGGYAVFGTGMAADYAIRYANEQGWKICCAVDDYRSGVHNGLEIIRWEEFLIRQSEFSGLIIGKHQKGGIQLRENILIPVIMVDPKLGKGNTPFFHENIKRIMSLKDVHKGGRCFIIGNGPSLNIEDINRIKGEITFASNKIYLLFDQTDWRPSYYFVEDYLVARNNRDRINGLGLKSILEYSVLDFLKAEDACVFQFFQPGCAEKFSHRPYDGIVHAGSVVGSQLQFAKYMGFREVYLMGIDFDFIIPEKVVGKIHGTIDILKSEGERNHFHPEYRPVGEEWTIPDMDRQRAFFDHAAGLMSEDFRIFNASRRTKLGSFPAVSFDDVAGGL